MTDGSYVAATKRYAVRLLIRGVGALTSPSTTLACARLLPRMRRLARSDRSSGIGGVHKILVVRPDGIGDVILTGPFLRELRRARPNARITLVIAPRALNLLQTCPYVDRVLTVRIPPPISVVDTWWSPLRRRVAALSLARSSLWSESYDLALVPRWGVDHHEASVLAYLSGAPDRVAYSEHVSADREKRNRGYDDFFTHLVDDRSVKHEVQRNLDLLSALGVRVSDNTLEAWLSDEDADFATESLPSPKEPLVALGPGAGGPTRVWPVDRFAEVGRWVMARGARLVLVGGPGEEALGDELRRRLGSGVIDLINKTTLRQSVAVLRQCSLFCGNDAGPMHLAAAAGIPVVEISCHPQTGDDLHWNSPTRFGPWGVPHRIVRPEKPAHGCTSGCRISAPHCILHVHVDSVIASVESLIDETDGIGGQSNSD